MQRPSSSAFATSMHPGVVTTPAVLGDAVGVALAERGHLVEILHLHQQYQMAARGAGRMVMIETESRVMFNRVTPANNDYVMG